MEEKFHMNDITVLVVDDESRMRKLIRDFLAQKGYSILDILCKLLDIILHIYWRNILNILLRLKLLMQLFQLIITMPFISPHMLVQI